jgi:hypothetical protein
MKPLVRIALSSIAVILSPLAIAAPPPPEIHACPDAAGNVVYQDDECDLPQPSRKAAAPAAKTAPPSRPAPTPKSRGKATPPIATAKRAPSTPGKGIKPVIDPSTFTSDPRWGSPERTLRTFIAAMKDGDRALARSCLIATALAEFGPRVDALPAEALRATVDGYTSLVLEGDLGPVWSIRAIRGKDRPKWIFFERAPDGLWKISAI